MEPALAFEGVPENHLPLHYLLTNDDGIHAPGLAALTEAIRLLPGSRCTVVAPDVERSQCGHRVTTHAPLTLTQVGEHRYMLDGTPADCVRAALFALKLRPDMVISGVNAGGNMGQDIVISGTVAGAREAAYHGVPAAAISHYLVSGIPVDWERVSRWTAQILSEFDDAPLKLPAGMFWNINLPHLPPGDLPLPEKVLSLPCLLPLNVSYAVVPRSEGVVTLQYNARYAERPAPEGSDVAACFGGRVSLSRLSL